MAKRKPAEEKINDSNSSRGLLSLEDDDLCRSVSILQAPLFLKRTREKIYQEHLLHCEKQLRAGIWQIYTVKKVKNLMNWLTPMCGSGTILWEALNFNQVVTRDFAFEGMKLFKKVEKFKQSEIKNEF